MERKSALLITVKIIHTSSKALLISFFGGWYRQRCQRCLTCTYIHQVTAGLSLHRNKWYKVRPEDFLFISFPLAPKTLCAICCYPRSKHSLPDTRVHDTAILFSSTAAAFSQHRQISSSCWHGQTPQCIPSFTPHLPKSAAATAEETANFLFTAKYTNI